MDLLPATSSSSGATFRYDSSVLPSADTHIRILEVSLVNTDEECNSDEAHFSNDLEGRLSTTPIDSPRPFKAISYTWGRESATDSIQLSGAVFPITPSLGTALRHFRNRHEVCTLWIDQICINQSDAAEKTAQVRLMNQIYSRAEEALVWLGPGAKGSDELMDAWKDIGQDARNLGLEGFYTKERIALLGPIMNNENPTDEATMQFQALLHRSTPIFESVLEPLKDWFERPWFKRVWVVQEFCLCTDTYFVYGSKIVHVDLVMLAVQILQFAVGNLFSNSSLSVEKGKIQISKELRQSAEIIYSEPTAPLFSARRRRQAFNRGAGTGDELFHILKKLYIGHGMEATMYRDRIYGLLGLAVDVDRLNIEPDYTITMVSPILTQTAKVLIENGRIEILTFSQFPKAFDHLPSWVPDWRSNLHTSFYNINENADEHLFDAAGNTEVGLVPTMDPILGLRGYVVDVIEEIGSPWWDEWWGERWNHARYLSCLSQVKLLWRISKLKDQPIYESLERREQALWRVPIGDLYWTSAEGTKRASADVAKAHEQCLANCEYFDEHRLLTSEEFKAREEEWNVKLRSGQLGSDYRYSMGTMLKKRPYMTQKGYLGMGPVVARPDDVVIVFLGGRIPYVLRPSPGGSHYSFVGEAYCDGIMDGEIMSKSKQQTFFIV